MKYERGDPAVGNTRDGCVVKSPSARSDATPSIGTFTFVLLIALLWRLAIAFFMPVISRDGVGFCWNARELERRGIEALQAAEFNQHPLYATCILAMHRLTALFGIPECPANWQLCGQVVSLTAGLLVVAMSGVLAARAARAIEAKVSPQRVAAAAMLLSAILPLNVWLSADVMSEQLFFVWYLGAATMLLGPWQPARSGLFGILVGLAFLTRPEGAAMGIAGALTVLMRAWTGKQSKCIACVLLMATGFLAVASPYWMALGKFSPKMDKQKIEEFVPAAGFLGFPKQQPSHGEMQSPSLSYAGVTRERYPIYEAAAAAVLETFRAGRVVVLLAALPALYVARRLLLRPPIFGLLAAASIHFTLTVILIYRHGYLSPRHTLAVVLLALPWAALTLDYLWRWEGRRLRFAGKFLVSIVVGVLAGYSLRVPNENDAHLLKATAWLNGLSGKDCEWVMVGGDSLKRVAFYSDIKIRDWNEEAANIEDRLESIRARLLDDVPRAKFLALETDVDAGPGDEPYGNDILLKRLRQMPQLESRLLSVFVTARQNRGGLVIYELR